MKEDYCHICCSPLNGLTDCLTCAENEMRHENAKQILMEAVRKLKSIGYGDSTLDDEILADAFYELLHCED